MKKSYLLLTIAILFAGCATPNTPDKNTEKILRIPLSSEEFPFSEGDIVLLETSHKAVILGTAYNNGLRTYLEYGVGFYKIERDSNGNLVKKKLLKISDLYYKVRYKDDTTETIRQRQETVNWLQIAKKLRPE